jgi:peptide/nickel transport system permease protein
MFKKNILLFGAKKLLSFLLTSFLIILILFIAVNVAQGDAAAMLLGANWTPEAYQKLREELGLNDPVYMQFGRYVWGVLHGDLGESYITKRAVLSEIIHSLPLSLQLSVVAMVIALAIGIPVGIFAATRRAGIADNVIRVIVMGGVSLPVFWVGLVSIYLFSVNLRILPTGGTGATGGGLADLRHLILPGFVLSTYFMAGIIRITRSSVLEVIKLDYIRMAKAKGLSERTIVYKHALKNALIPVLTLGGVYFGAMMGHSVITETVFAWPGLGRLIIDSIRARDTPLIMGSVLTLCVVYLLVNLVVDILYTIVDPRIKLK